VAVPDFRAELLRIGANGFSRRTKIHEAQDVQEVPFATFVLTVTVMIRLPGFVMRTITTEWRHDSEFRIPNSQFPDARR